MPLHQFAQFSLVVLTKIATNSLYQIGQLSFVTPTFSHQIGHHATQFLPSEVGILKFRATYMCAKYREKHRSEELMYVF